MVNKGEWRITKTIEAAIKDGTIEDKIEKLEAHKREIEAKIKECQEALERSKKPKLAIPFVPEEKEKYWLYTTGPYYCTTANEKDEDDFARIKAGNCFRTKEEAKLAYEKRCAETELLMLCDGLEREGSEKIWFPVLQVFCSNGRPYSSIWKVTSDNYDKMIPYRFASAESCQAAIEKLGDRKLRLVFNIPLED